MKMKGKLFYSESEVKIVEEKLEEIIDKIINNQILKI
jgi:hypothetical protein